MYTCTCIECAVIFSLSLQEELTLAGYKKHVEACEAPPPLTADEEELKMLKESEVV